MTATALAYVAAFTEALAEVEAIHGAADLKVTEPSPRALNRVTAVWFLPALDGTGEHVNNGFHIDAIDPDGYRLPTLEAWSHNRRNGYAGIKVAKDHVTVDDVRAVLRMIGLLPEETRRSDHGEL